MVHKHLYPPAFVTLNGKKYLVPTWKEVSLELDLKDVKWEKETFEKKEPKVIINTFTSSSDNSILYETKKVEQIDGTFKYYCDCPGRWRAKDKLKGCKHIQKMRELYPG